MAKKCIYCRTALDDSSVLDVCRRCGIGVWGERMFNAIVENMENAREVGDLFQGSVSIEKKQGKKHSIVKDALVEIEEKQKIEKTPFFSNQDSGF
ncbi:hypothetical protein HY450_02875 [Candidatus Pacearchaeota archaeon]|nr:hypothetical protein [Candidatus Pacearchaeota archaeon]